MDSQEFRTSIWEKYTKLRDKFDLEIIEINPCSIQSKDDLTLLIKKIIKLFTGRSEVNFLENNEASLLNQNCVQFYAKSELISLSIDSRFGHIEIDFFKTLERIASIYGKMFKKINNDQIYVSGNVEDMKEAWQEGFPIQIDEVDFLHKHYTGKRYKKSEIGSKLVLNQVIDINYYQDLLLEGLNNYLIQKDKKIQYNQNQLMVYSNFRGSLSVSLNGYYCKCIQISEPSTIFDNGILNQIFLINHISLNPDKTLLYRTKDGEEIQIKIPIKEFINKFGKEDE